MRRRSSSPRRTASSSAAHSTSSSRDSGKMRAFGTPPTWWLARPARCRNVAIERGEPSWQTRSTSPMSMPSSSEAVATSTLSSPFLSRCSALRRSSFAMLPWCAITWSGPSSSDRWRAARSAMRRVLTKTSVVRCDAARSASRAYTCCPHFVSTSRLRAARPGPRSRGRARGRGPTSTISHVRAIPGVPTRNRAISSIGFCVADSRCAPAASRVSAASRSERQREMAAALVAGERVDLVDDHRARGRQHRRGPTPSPAARTATRAS